MAENPSQSSRRVPIVAIFGSSIGWTLPKAEAIGSQLARRDCIVLTGADRQKDPDTVKERAIDGVEEVRSAGAHLGSWVGVARKDAPSDPNLAFDGHSIVLCPGFDHKRNYLEARMCDVAIALQGGPGTRSEVVFALASGKPVILVADDAWLEQLPRDGSPSEADLALLVDLARAAVNVEQASGDAHLDGWLQRESLIRDIASSPPVYQRVPRTAAEVEIVKTTVEMLLPIPVGGFVGALPNLDGDVQVKSKRKYDMWLQKLAEIMPGLA